MRIVLGIRKGGGVKKIKGYKAFHKDMTCNRFKFKEGEVYEEEKAVTSLS